MQSSGNFIETHLGAFTIVADISDNGKRLDFFLSEKLSDQSRSHLSELIKNQHIKVNQTMKKASYKVRPGDTIHGIIPEEEPLSFEPECIDLDILYEDDDVIVLNKSAGIVVHPAPGNWSGTLVNGLLYHCPSIESTGVEFRPGIVHRLDKDTSGVMVIAKNKISHINLSLAFKNREVHKEYSALVLGKPIDDSGTIDLPIGRHPIDRKKMSVVQSGGRRAITHFSIAKQLIHSTLLSVTIETGRTHQIRVHCSAKGFPIVGDPIYGQVRPGIYKQFDASSRNLLHSASRQMLHSSRLEFNHPATGRRMSFDAPLSNDMESLIIELESLT